jgi:hypothetical protein
VKSSSAGRLDERDMEIVQSLSATLAPAGAYVALFKTTSILPNLLSVASQEIPDATLVGHVRRHKQDAIKFRFSCRLRLGVSPARRIEFGNDDASAQRQQAPGSFEADAATGSDDNHDVARQRRSIELAASDQHRRPSPGELC